MPRANRVTPIGEIVALSYRGLLMGNRGVLHDADGNVARPWATRSWLACRTGFAGRTREVMTPGRYTELFFLDEVHALSAGHRPCSECRREAFRAFLRASGHERAEGLDRALETERSDGTKGSRRFSRGKRVRHLPHADVPHGAMILVGRTAFARTASGFIGWHEDEPEGYLTRFEGRARSDRDTLWATLKSGAPLAVLTPPTSARALRRGYGPIWHPSAENAERIV